MVTSRLGKLQDVFEALGDANNDSAFRTVAKPCPVHGKTRAVKTSTDHIGYICCGRKVEA